MQNWDQIYGTFSGYGKAFESSGEGSTELGISERPKKYFATNRKPKKILSNTIHFAKVKDDMMIMETHGY